MTRAGHDGTRDAQGLLGSLEYAVMRALWQDSPSTVKSVLGRINEARPTAGALAYTTVMTVLGRLHEKGLLERVKAGRGYEYMPRFDEPGLVEHLGRQEISEVLERYGPVALAQFAAVLEEADPTTLHRVRRLLESDDGA